MVFDDVKAFVASAPREPWLPILVFAAFHVGGCALAAGVLARVPEWTRGRARIGRLSSLSWFVIGVVAFDVAGYVAALSFAARTRSPAGAVSDVTALFAGSLIGAGAVIAAHAIAGEQDEPVRDATVRRRKTEALWRPAPEGETLAASLLVSYVCVTCVFAWAAWEATRGGVFGGGGSAEPIAGGAAT